MTTVYVKAYTRADGTQVRAYTREIKGASNKDISLSMQDLSKDIERSFEDFSHSTKNDIDMYESAIKSMEEYLGDYPLTIANAKMEDIDHIEAIKSHLDNAKADLKILKTVREKAGMDSLINSDYQSQIENNLPQNNYTTYAYVKDNFNKIRDFAKHQTWQKQPKNDDKQLLVFDGEKLSFYENGDVKKSWNGVSGRDGYQTKKYQYEKNTGPLPEGMYAVRQERYQEMDIINGVLGLTKPIKDVGSWPGSVFSWGTRRVWLEPSNETEVKGRDNFSIHGGVTSGSAGCIDLTNNMNDFAKWYRGNKKDMILLVKHKK